MSDGLWYLDQDTPGDITAQLYQSREDMSEKQRLDLAAHLLEGMEPKSPPATAIPADAAPESQQGYGRGEASGPRHPGGQQSAQLLQELRADRARGWQDPDKVRAFLSAKLNEAGA